MPVQADRLGEPSVTLNAEQKNLLVNAYDQRQVHLHQQAVYVSQDKGPIVASEAREAISELESQAQQRHERAMMESKREVEEMAQQRLRMAESAIAGHAEEAFKNRVSTITQLQNAEIQEVNKLRTELQSAQVLKEEMQLEGAKKLSLYDSRLEEMRNLVNELKATNDRQRQEYESQLHRCHSIIAAHQPPIRIPDDKPLHKAEVPGKSIDDLNISMIPEAPGLPKPDRGRGRSRERVATSTNADKGRLNPRDPDPPSSPPSSSSESSESAESLDKKKIARMIKKQLSKIGGKSESSQRPKEADRVIVPKFPNPEAYRNSDAAFKWIEHVWEESMTLDTLADSGTFTTLDAKLMSALTNVVDGDLARQLDLFKEQEAKKGIHAKGRQALFMIHKHFSTSQKHGAVYDLEDLMAIQMINDDLKGFVSRWDAVIAGMKEDPGDRWKEAYFHNSIKRFNPLEHDLAIYDRAPEGDANHTYAFLIKSARDYLERRRLEKMRNANKRAISGKGREATPAPTRNAAPGVPGAGLCYDFQKGKCTRGDACKYRHEKSKGEEKGKGKGKKGKSRSPSRTRSMSPGSRSEICRFFAAGTCRRGKDCAFKHQKPAAAASSDERKNKKKNKKKSKKDKKGERQASRSSSRGSNSSKGSQSQRSPRGGKPAASSGSAAACLLKAVVMVAAMRPSTSLPCRPEGMALPSSLSSNSHRETDMPKLRFDDNPEVYKHEIDHNAGFVPVLKTSIHERKVKKYGQNPPVDKIKIEKITQDSILAAQMLQSAVHRETEGRVSFCNYNCDSDIGCKHCIRSDLRALPGKMPRKPALPTEIAWIADTGSAQDLVCETMVHPSSVYESNFPLELTTANGSQSAQKQADVHVGCIDKSIQPYVLPDTPAVVSVGMRCLKDGWDFVWRAFSRPYFKKKNGERIKLEIKDFVPYLPSSDGQVPAAVGIPFGWKDASGNGRPSSRSRIKATPAATGEDGGDYEPSIGGDDVDQAELDPENLIIGGEVAPGPPSAVTPGFDGEPSDIEAEDDDAQGVDPVEDERLVPKDKNPRRDRGQQALKEEARSLSHLMTHTPKNPYCDVCNKAKMYKPTSRSKGGSTTVECSEFGEHITGDHLIIRTDEEEAIDGERVALVVKDIATNFKWVYPSARRTAKDCVIALKHFTSHVDDVGVFYSDNADELRAACEELKWRHITSFDYVSKTNAVAERNLRTTLEGTRANLEQAGLHHSYWPHAARHWCMSHNIDEDPDFVSPWKLRFGERFKGPHIPFGARIDYWTGPKHKPKKGLKFDPSSSPGVFLGYAIHPEFIWRREYLVIPLKEAMEKDFSEPVGVIRVFNLSLPETGIQFPLKGRYNAIREGLYLGYGLPENGVEVDLSVFDAKPVEQPVDEDKIRSEVDELMAEAGIEDPGRDAPDPNDPGSEPLRGPGKEIEIADDDDPVEMIEVIDPKTGAFIKIPKDSESYYSASGVKARRYKGSSKPDSIPSDLWRDASKAEREREQRNVISSKRQPESMKMLESRVRSLTNASKDCPSKTCQNHQANRWRMKMNRHPRCLSFLDHQVQIAMYIVRKLS